MTYCGYVPGCHVYVPGYYIYVKISMKEFTYAGHDSCAIISLSDLPFKSYVQKSKCSIHVYHWLRHIRFRVKTLAA